MQFKVPQNIDMADRIVGPLTLIQFLYVLIGGIIIYALLNIVAPVSSALFLALAGPIALFTLALAFLKIQDQPFPKFVGAFFLFMTKPKMRIWQREGIDPDLVITPDKPKDDQTIHHKIIKKSELERVVQSLDTGGAVVHPPVAPASPTKKVAVTPPNYLKRGRPTLDNVKKGNQAHAGVKA